MGDTLTELKYETLTPAVSHDKLPAAVLLRYRVTLVAMTALAAVFAPVVPYPVVHLWQVTTF